jgi:hypothetical protein
MKNIINMQVQNINQVSILQLPVKGDGLNLDNDYIDKNDNQMSTLKLQPMAVALIKEEEHLFEKRLTTKRSTWESAVKDEEHVPAKKQKDNPAIATSSFKSNAG